MDLVTIKKIFTEDGIFHSEDKILNKPSVIGYEKKFRWRWIATQLNTFIIVSDFDREQITPDLIEKHVDKAFTYARKNYKGWPRGLQSGIGVISVLKSDKVSPEAESYCRKLKTGKKWAGFTVPVIINSLTDELIYFNRKPIWGAIYYPHFKKLINNLK